MELKDALLNLKMIMFGGKGGVGKTTCASSSAIWAAEHGRNTLIISTDPAHSLGDSLGITLPPGDPMEIPGVANLTGLEINPSANLSEFRDLININPMEGMQMPGMMENMSMMEELQDLTSANPPGIDETLALLKVLEFIETDHDYDLIIFDTAPTGHTLRFLSLPETLSGWIGKLLKMRMRLGSIFGFIKRMFTGNEKEDDNSVEVLERLNLAILNAREDLTNPVKNSFVIVMIPEEMAISETTRLLSELDTNNIPNSNIVINQLYQNTEDLCEFCQARRNMQQKNMGQINTLFKDKLGKNLIKVPLFKGEVREFEKLREFSGYLIP